MLHHMASRTHQLNNSLNTPHAQMFAPLTQSLTIARKHFESQKNDNSSKISVSIATDT